MNNSLPLIRFYLITYIYNMISKHEKILRMHLVFETIIFVYNMAKATQVPGHKAHTRCILYEYTIVYVNLVCLFTSVCYYIFQMNCRYISSHAEKIIQFSYKSYRIKKFFWKDSPSRSQINDLLKRYFEYIFHTVVSIKNTYWPRL